MRILNPFFNLKILIAFAHQADLIKGLHVILECNDHPPSSKFLQMAFCIKILK